MDAPDNGKITLLFNEHGLEIEVRDVISNTPFLKIEMSPHQVCSAFSRIALTGCKISTRELSKVGKKHESKPFVFEIQDEHWSTKQQSAAVEAKKTMPARLGAEHIFWLKRFIFQKRR